MNLGVDRTVAHLLLRSTASIAHNVGFSVATANPMNFLMNLMVNFINNLALKMKKFEDLNNEELTFRTATALFSLDIDQLHGYIRTVQSFGPQMPALPGIPAAIAPSESNQHKTFHFDGTTFGGWIDDNSEFPDFTDCTAAELGLEVVGAKERGGADHSEGGGWNDSMDSLATPIMAFRSKRRAQGQSVPLAKKKIAKATTRSENGKGRNGLKFVHSKVGLRVRLLNVCENTPPGYFSSKSIRGGKK